MSRKSCSQADSRPQRDQVVTTTTSGLPMLKPKCLKRFGAGSGNRTRIFSLEGCCSTTELYPRIRRCGLPPSLQISIAVHSLERGGGSRTRTCEGVRQRIYSPPPLPLG